MSGQPEGDPAADWVPSQDLGAIVGRRFVYTYANGWRYELYVRNEHAVDYRIHSGHVGGRWTKGQEVNLVRLDDDLYQLSWTEPTGTSVVVTVMPARRLWHGVIFFPDWIRRHGELTALYQNDHLAEMREYRDRGPSYPIFVVAEFARITFVEYAGLNNDEVISCAPADLPPQWPTHSETTE